MGLQALLGEELYNKLSEKLGDEITDFSNKYANGEITEEEVQSKLKELGLIVEEQQEKEQSTVEGQAEEGVNVEPTEPKEETTVEQTEEEQKDIVESILEEGWLLESGEVDHSKIKDESLSQYIKAINDRLKQSEWDYNIKLGIMAQALKENMHDVSDVDRLLDKSGITINEQGEVLGVKEAFNSLRSTKPYLFKTVEETNPIVNEGFNPTGASIGRPKSFSEAIQATLALK